jgi:hypothetical protein
MWATVNGAGVVGDLDADDAGQRRGQPNRQQRDVQDRATMLDRAHRGVHSQAVGHRHHVVRLGGVLRMHALPDQPHAVRDLHSSPLRKP